MKRRRPHLVLLCATVACGAPVDTTKAVPAAPAPVAAKVVPPAPPPPVPLTAAERAAAPGRIVYLSERPAGAAIVQTFPSGHGSKDLLQGPPAKEAASVFPGPVAPDGSALAVITVETRGGAHLERIEVRPLGPDSLGEAVWRSDPAPQVRNASWAPDGRALAFEAAFTSFRDIYSLDLSPGTAPKLTRLTDDPAGNYEPAFSPDGTQIAFVTSRDGNAEVYVMQADGSQPRRLTDSPRDDWGPVWAPDGARLAFLSNREDLDRIFLIGRDGAGLTRLAPVPASISLDKLPEFEASEAEPAFSPDGRALVYSVRTGPQRAGLRRYDLATAAITELTPGTASDREPVFAPGGALMVFASDRDGDPELYLMRPDGTGVTRLTERPGPDWLPRWSAR